MGAAGAEAAAWAAPKKDRAKCTALRGAQSVAGMGYTDRPGCRRFGTWKIPEQLTSRLMPPYVRPTSAAARCRDTHQGEDEGERAQNSRSVGGPHHRHVLRKEPVLQGPLSCQAVMSCGLAHLDAVLLGHVQRQHLQAAPGLVMQGVQVVGPARVHAGGHHARVGVSRQELLHLRKGKGGETRQGSEPAGLGTSPGARALSRGLLPLPQRTGPCPRWPCACSGALGMSVPGRSSRHWHSRETGLGCAGELEAGCSPAAAQCPSRLPG